MYAQVMYVLKVYPREARQKRPRNLQRLCENGLRSLPNGILKSALMCNIHQCFEQY